MKPDLYAVPDELQDNSVESWRLATRFRSAAHSAAQELGRQRHYIPGFDNLTDMDLALIRMEAARAGGLWPPSALG
jgi:hypothetical protein